MFVDTHCHLYEKEFDADRIPTVQRAIDAGVTKLFLPNIDLQSIEKMLELAFQFPTNCFPMMGIHPCYVDDELYSQQLDTVEKHLKEGDFCAIGEIGIDLHWRRDNLETQKKVFEHQVMLAIEHQKPVSVHSREAFGACLESIKKFRNKGLRGVFHCFTGSVQEANEAIGCGFLLGIGGVLTYKNTHLRATLAHIDLEHLLLETDSPYLPPVPHRGKRNESSYIAIIAQTLAEVYGIGIEKIGEKTSQNAFDLFKR